MNTLGLYGNFQPSDGTNKTFEITKPLVPCIINVLLGDSRLLRRAQRTSKNYSHKAKTRSEMLSEKTLHIKVGAGRPVEKLCTDGKKNEI